MRKILLVLALFLLLPGWGVQAVASGGLPSPPSQWVTDGAGFLSPAVRQSLDRRLSRYQQATGHQVLVWIGDSTGGAPLEEWAVQTFEGWKVGRKGLDDGLVLFILAKDKKLRIEVGYGLEGQMPDALASRILRDAIVPRIRAGDRDGAVTAGTDQILGTLGGEVGGSRQTPQGVPHLGLGAWILIVILGGGFLILLVTHPSLAVWFLFSLMSGGRGGGGGGGSGGWSGGGGRSGGGGASGSW
jgi:uncharacterized protein